MKLYSVFILLTLTLSVKAFTWTPCDVDKVPFTPDVVQLVPDPPAAGGQVTFKISGNAVHDVQSGFISIDVAYEGTQIYEEVDDLCGKTSCPIKTGPIDITYIQDLPPIAPPPVPPGRGTTAASAGQCRTGPKYPLNSACFTCYEDSMLVSYSIQPRGKLQLASVHESAGYRILICAESLLQGGYDVQVVARSTEGEELMCVVVHFEMLPPSFVQKILPSSWLGQKGSQTKPISAMLPAAARRLLGL